MTTQINQLTELTTTSDGDLLLIRESATGVDKKIQSQNLRAKATTKDDVGLGNVDNVSAADLRDRSTHTGTQTLSTISDAGTIASQDANSVNIDGGNIDGTPIGVSSASSGAFTTLTTSGNVGIGTTSVGTSYRAIIKGTNDAVLQLDTSSANGSYINFVKDGSTNAGYIGASASIITGGTTTSLGLRSENNLLFSTNGNAERMRIDSSGHAIIPAGVTLGTAAGVYNAANTLDDYETGTFQVTLAPFTSGTITVDATRDTLAYTKIGRVVTIVGQIYVSSVASPVGSFVEISGFPFINAQLLETAGIVGGAANFYPGTGSTLNAIGQQMQENQSILRCYLDASTVIAGAAFNVSFSYFTS